MVYDLIQTRDKLNKQLTENVNSIFQAGKELAEAEKNYRLEATKKTLELKLAGEKVTIIELLLKGDEKIAELRFKRDCCNALYESKKDIINMCKLQLRMLEQQIEREWCKK